MNAESSRHRICIACPYEPVLTESFLRTHIQHLPADLALIGARPQVNGRTVLPLSSRLAYKAGRVLFGHTLQREMTAAYRKAFAEHRITTVLAEYATTATEVMEACALAGLPLTAHFHGFDASERSILSDYEVAYRRLFASHASLVVVSQPMRDAVIALGAVPERVFLNPYGVDCAVFDHAAPGTSAPVLLSVGRFIDKKAPALTIRAFAQALTVVPDARLKMIGEGPLLDSCRALVQELRITEAVDFLGPQPSAVVRTAMQGARALVQHSLTAPSGDSEGTPVALIEASACGLPVIATRHTGIPEIVLHEKTGLLVKERDVLAMANMMALLLSDPRLAEQMGREARQHALAHFQISDRIATLRQILMSGPPMSRD